MSKADNLIPFNRQPKRTLVMILASTNNGIVGCDNALPWNCKRDMHFFKRSTLGNVVIMGRNTYVSIGSKPLPRRINIVVTNHPETIEGKPNLIVVTSIDTAVFIARSTTLDQFDRHTQSEHIFIIGGVELYKQTACKVDEILHSTINLELSNGIGQDLFTQYLPLHQMENEILYYNKLTADEESTHTLKEVIHYRKPNLNNAFHLRGNL